MKKTTHLLMLIFVTNAYCADQNLLDNNTANQPQKVYLKNMRASLESFLGTEETIRNTFELGIQECENAIKVLDRQSYAYNFLLQSRTNQNSMEVILNVMARINSDKSVKETLEKVIKFNKDLLATSSADRLKEEANKVKKEIAEEITTLEQDKFFLKDLEDAIKTTKDVLATYKEAPEQTKEEIEKEIAFIKLKEGSYKVSLTTSMFDNRAKRIDTIIGNLFLDRTEIEHLEGKIAAIKSK